MKEGIVGVEREFFKYSETEMKEIIITEEQYHKELKEYDKEWKEGKAGCSYIPPVDFREYKKIRLSLENIYEIVGLLSYDKGLNQFAVKHGYHPASGYPLCNAHRRNIKLRDEQAKLFGIDLEEDCDLLGKKRCKKCRK